MNETIQGLHRERIAEAELQDYSDLTPQQIRTHLLDMLARDLPAPGKRQVPSNAVETLLCYGLFSLIDPHRLLHG